MKSKFVVLSTVISAGILSLTGNAFADDRHPDMPRGGQKCYPGRGGCPNRIETVEGQEHRYSGDRRDRDNRNSRDQRYGDDDRRGNDRDQRDRRDNRNNNNGRTKQLKMQSAEKFKGTVENVNRERYPDGRQFINIVLDTDEGQKTIMVGPASYVDQSKVKLQIGDKVTVTGFRVDANGDEIIMAKEIDKNGNVLKLLNDQRQPMWSNGNSQNYGNRR